MANFNTFSNLFEDGFAIEQADGTRLEAVIVHLPGEENATFHLAETALDDDGNPIVNELYSCPVPTR